MRSRLDDYLENVREIERRIQRTETQNAADVESLAAPVGIPQSFEEHMAVMFDLLAVAYRGRSDARVHVHDRPRSEPAHVSRTSA